jgi:hypothetical protein
MSHFVRRLFNTSDKRDRESEPASGPGLDAAPSAAGLEGIGAYSARAPAGSEPAAEREQPSRADPTDADTEEHHRPDAADEASIEVGDQVAVILSSAKQAAQRLQESARQEADSIRAQAEQEAGARHDEAERELARKREEDATLRAEAEAYARSTREAADRHATETRRKLKEESAKQRATAEQEANEIRRAAKRQSEQLVSEAFQRQKGLTAEVKRSEARLEQLLGVFCAMTSQMEGLLEVDRGRVSGEEARAEAAPVAEELGEALRPQPLRSPPAKRRPSG